MSYDGYASTPGRTASVETVEAAITWRRSELNRFNQSGLISGASTDTGHTNYTTILRPGLLMGMVTATRLIVPWAPTAIDGSEKIYGILSKAIYTQELGANANKFPGGILTHGYAKAESVIIPGETTAGLAGKNLEFIVRDLLEGRIEFNDAFGPRITTITADITIDRTWHGAEINNLGDAGTAIVTLPAPKAGFRLILRQWSNQILRAATPGAGQLKLSDGTTAQTLDLAAATNKIMHIVGMNTSTYHATISGATS